MNTDIRLSVNFFSHIKTLKLERLCGKEGVLCLLKLWVWAAVNRPSGDLSGFCSGDLELFSGWDGESGVFVAALRSVGWLDGEEGAFWLHGWGEFQTWVTGMARREDIARLGALARKNYALAQRLKAQGVKGITKEQYAEYVKMSVDQYSCLARATSTAPAPAPAPAPSPSPSPAPKRKHSEAKNQKDQKPKTDFERQWDGDPIQKANPLDYIRKIQDIAKNAPKIPERVPGKTREETQNDVG